MSRPRIIGTTIDSIREEESKLGRVLTPSFKTWLLKNNGLNIGNVHIYPVRNENDVRKTWESLTYNLNNGWAAWLEIFEKEGMCFSHLLPFGYYGTGDYYCFDYSNPTLNSEFQIVRWLHETGECEHRAISFAEFEKKVLASEFIYD